MFLLFFFLLPPHAAMSKAVAQTRGVRIEIAREGPHIRREDPPVLRLASSSPRPINNRQILFSNEKKKKSSTKGEKISTPKAIRPADTRIRCPDQKEKIKPAG